VTVNALADDDVIDASGLAASSALLTANGGDGDDVIIGGNGPDTLNGDAGDDVIIGGPGADTIDGGTGDNVVIDSVSVASSVSAAKVVGKKWLKAHARTVRGKTVLTVDGEKTKLPRAKLAKLVRAVS
jgi:Ca2+-binding RTX toxin-like protein